MACENCERNEQLVAAMARELADARAEAREATIRAELLHGSLLRFAGDLDIHAADVRDDLTVRAAAARAEAAKYAPGAKPEQQDEAAA